MSVALLAEHSFRGLCVCCQDIKVRRQSANVKKVGVGFGGCRVSWECDRN